MKLPEKSRYQVYEVAKRWGTDESQIRDYLKTGKLTASVEVSGTLAAIANYNNMDFVYSWQAEAAFCDLAKCGVRLTIDGNEVKTKEKIIIEQDDILITLQDIQCFESEYEICIPTNSKTLTVKTPEAVKESTRTIETLQKILIAVAMDGYGYDPAARSSTVVGDIQAALDKIGLTVSENTIRTHLKAGAAMVPPATG